MKTIFITFILAALFINASFSQCDTSYFKVTKSTSQGWLRRPAGSGRGINYTFNIIFKTSAKVNFDTVWITGGNGLDIRFAQPAWKDSSFEKGNTFTLYAEQYYPGQIDRLKGKTNNKESSLPPVNYTGKALLRYTVENKTYYYSIPEMDTLPFLAYP